MEGSKLKIELLENGTIKVIAKEMIGDEAEILEELQALAKEVGGTLEVEKHIEGHHHHHHGKDGHHVHTGKK